MTSHLNTFFGGPEDAPQGYAYSHRAMRDGYERIGVDLKTDAEKIIFHSVPWGGFSWRDGQQGGIFTMWEHSQVPPEMQPVLGIFDFILTPCTYSAELFAPYNENIHVVPLGIDPDAFYPGPEPDGQFTILANALNVRKGISSAIEAFVQSGLLGRARLLLKGPQKSIERYAPSNLPNGVEVLSDTLSQDELRELYQSAHCYLSMSRGEGWDLMAWEALACGVPTIVPDHTAYRDWNHLAQFRLESWDSQPSPVKRYGDPGEWCVMDPVEAGSALAQIHLNYERFRIEALESSETIRTEWRWEDTCQKVVDLLSPLPPLVKPGKERKQEPLVAVETVKYLSSFDISGFRAGPLKEGSRHRFPPEVARVLGEAGYVEVKETT